MVHQVFLFANSLMLL